MPALIARLLVEPDLLDALERHDTDALPSELVAELDTLSAVDVRGLRTYQKLLQLKRLEVIEAIFPASLPAARGQYGVDGLAAGFWRFYRQPDTVPVHDIHREVAEAWVRYAKLLSGEGILAWLGDLGGYELMRFRAVFDAGPVAPLVGPPQMLADARPVLISGASVAAFAFDVPGLRRSLLDAHPVGRPEPRVTRLLSWYRPDSGLNTSRLGASAAAVLLACDGSRTVGHIVDTVAGPAKRDQVVELVRRLALAGALHFRSTATG